MGSGGRACCGGQAALAAQRLAQKKAVEKAAFGIDHGFDASTLQDLPLPPVNEAYDTSYFDAFAGAPLDPSLWDNSQDVPAFGNLAVDALFCMPSLSPNSPIKGAGGSVLSLGSPLRAPGSPITSMPTPTVSKAEVITASDASPRLAAPAPTAVPVVTSIPIVDILTSHASSGERDVVVVCTPRALKRTAEEQAEPGGGRRVRRRFVADEDSEESDTTAASLQREDIVPVLIAAPLTSSEQAEAALPNIPASQQTACGEIVTLSPTLWRDARRNAHPPFRIHVNVGLHSMRAPGIEAPITMFGAIHPRIITTGQPHRRLGRARPGRPDDAPALPLTRATRAHGGAERTASSGDLGSALRREKGAERDACSLQEVWLLKRSLQRGQGHLLLDAHRCCGPFDGTTLPEAPAWLGTFAVDIAARVADPSGSTFWIKACNRSVQDVASS